MKKNFYEKYFKRLLDFVLSFLGILILMPIIFIVALLIKIKLGGPIIFKQERPGFNTRIFTLYKFRTMSNDVDSNGVLLPDEKRFTKFGNFLRATSLDELPELFNILKGEMSFVGPRPLLTKYIPLYSEDQMKRHSVRPGLTGLAQINGRNNISWEEKFKFDVYYSNNVSFFLDVKILFLTFFKTLKSEGINNVNSIEVEAFKGNNKSEESK